MNDSSERAEGLERLYLRVDEVARLLSFSRAKCYEMVMRGEIPSVSFGRSRRVSLAALRKMHDELNERIGAA